MLAEAQWAHLRARTLPGQALTVARQLAEWPQAASVRVTDGAFEVYAWLTGLDARTLWRSTQEGIARIPQIVRADMQTVVESLDIGRAERLDVLSPRQVAALRRQQVPPTPPGHEATRFSEADAELWRLLADGRMEVARAADHLGRSPSAVSRRIARLQADGYLDFVTMIAEPLSSAPHAALIWCRIDPDELGLLQRHRAELHWAGLLSVATGRSNVMAMANLTTLGGLNAVIAQLRAVCPSVEIHDTQLSAQAVKRHSRMVTDEELWTDEITNPYPDLSRAFE